MRHEKMTAWAGHEDEAILEMVVRHGPRWSKIAEDLPGRSVASVRNRYLRIQKGVKKRSEGTAKNRCHACGQMKLGHVCHAKVAAAIPGPVLAPLALFPHIPAAGPAAMFSAIDSLLVGARLAPALDSAHSSCNEQASPVGEEPAGVDAVASLPDSCRSELEVTFAKAAPARPVVVPICASGTTQGPVDSRALGVDSPEFSHDPAQDEEDAQMLKLLKKDPTVRQELAA
mmetsp:Transcript_29727/g.70095  ORF Transcript_29727/g.70095 Transcript_29727/m.70095 type:complete len:229 (-) Transcript_29727:207-893(-)